MVVLREISAGLDLRSQEGRNQLLQRAKPLLTAITAPATALMLRKEVAALAGVSQAGDDVDDLQRLLLSTIR